MRRLVTNALACLMLGAGLARADPWPTAFTDPGAARKPGGPADLVLPMPCGAAMAFQRVAVPMQADDPLADRRLLLGQSLDQTGYADYLRTAFLRGPFAVPGDGGGATAYYIARYEMTEGQWRVLHGDCAAPKRRDRIAKGGLSWFDAVDAARLYTEWLAANAPDALPKADGAAAFLRLPTGDEWEYAVRGGARVNAARFAERVYFGTGDMRDHALHQAAGSGRGRLGPVGLRHPNPLGLYDVYGNAEELVLDPFRLNVAGRLHGQAGGVVTRGGSVLSTAEDLYSAARTEYPPYGRDGQPLRLDTFGVRLVISAPVITSDAALEKIRKRWLAAARAVAPPGQADPDLLLSGLIAAEPDTRRKAALTALQLAFRRERDQAQTARLTSARSTLLSGAMFVGSLRETDRAIDDKAANIRILVQLQRAGGGSDMLDRQVRGHVQQIDRLRGLRSAYLLSYRAALEALTNETGAYERKTAYDVLREELSLSRQSSVQDDLDRFWKDLAAYGKRPDMNVEALLNLALK